MRFTRMLLGGGALHPHAFKGGRKPGQQFGHTIGQVTPYEWAAVGAGLGSFSLTLTLWYNKYFILAESSWVDHNYDYSYPYQRDWAEKYAKPYRHLRPNMTVA